MGRGCASPNGTTERSSTHGDDVRGSCLVGAPAAFVRPRSDAPLQRLTHSKHGLTRHPERPSLSCHHRAAFPACGDNEPTGGRSCLQVQQSATSRRQRSEIHRPSHPSVPAQGTTAPEERFTEIGPPLWSTPRVRLRCSELDRQPLRPAPSLRPAEVSPRGNCSASRRMSKPISTRPSGPAISPP